MSRFVSPLFVLPILAMAALPAQEGEKAGKQAGGPLAEPEGLEVIQIEDLKKWAGFLASDKLQGRLTGSPGQEAAARFVAKHFASLGLEPLGDPDSNQDGKRGYHQKYPVTRTSLDLQKTRISLEVDGEATSSFTRGFAVLPSAKKSAELVAAEGEFVYAGLVSNRTYKKGVQLDDWTGKIPVFVLDLPKAGPKFAIERQMMQGMFLLMSLKRRTEKLARQGAKAAVYCVFDDDSAISNMLTYTSVAPGQDMLKMKGGMGMGAMMTSMAASVPTVFLSRKLSTAIVSPLGLDAKTAREVQTEEDVAKLKAAKGAVVLAVKNDPKAFATNVVAVLRGSDPKLASEAIVYSAHMDHVGLRMDGDAYNGADDNASGTAGLMAIAKAYASRAKAPRRSIIFLAVSGEELGLWGSAWYAKNPTWDIDDIVANINTDMIGRNGPESGAMSVTVTPSNRHKKFSTIVQDAATIGEQMGMKFTSGDKYYQRSDHYNFAKEGIPVVFFCNGEHEDYHQVSDHAEKLDFAKMQRISRLAYWTGVRVAMRDERPRDLGRSESWLPDGRKEPR